MFINEYKPSKANQFLFTERRIIKLDNLVENIILARPKENGFYAFHVGGVNKSQPFKEILTKYTEDLEPLEEKWELDTNILTIKEPSWIYHAEIDANRIINENLRREVFFKSDNFKCYDSDLHKFLLTVTIKDVLNGLYVVKSDFLIDRIKTKHDEYIKNIKNHDKR